MTDTAAHEALAQEVVCGLRSRPRQLPCKLFYDERGSELFERICQTPEYYLTRTEMAILEALLPLIAGAVGPGVEVIEFGSGSGRKTRLLLDALPRPAAITLIEISPSALAGSLTRLRREQPRLAVDGVEGDYTRPLHLPPPAAGACRRLVFFPGSTIGNFAPEEAAAFLRRVHGLVDGHGLLLLGTDLDKDPAVLEAAYDDDAGWTAAFNRNLLVHCNRLFDGDCDPQAFLHRAPYDPDHRRIDMLLEARRDCSFTMAGEDFRLRAGETIHTEHSHKYRIRDVDELAAAAGWRRVTHWSDPQDWFALHLLAATDD